MRERLPDGTTGTRYWEALQVDALGAVTQEKLGNDRFTLRYLNPATGLVESIATGTAGQATSLQDLSMQWNRVGDLTRRTDHKVDRRKDVFYDGMGRMTQVQRRTAAGSLLDTQAFTYGPTGNLLSKDVFSNYQYHTNRPNAVQSVSGPGGTRGYQYDANGNLTSVTGPAPRTVTWWSHNKPRRMTRNADNYSEYWYGPGGDRSVFKQESRIAGALSTVIYGSALYERRTQGATVEHTHYIQANGVTVATVRRYGTSTANTTRYLHRDHLGSVVLITNESGAVTETLAYDAWGKRRPPSTWITPGAGTFLHAQWLRRGFTAHEHIDHVGLIHMGGRVYDPEIGRFLSPDPFVQYPGSAQGMNRYAYVGNNPLSATDPSGYFIKRLFRTALIVGAAYFTGGAAAALWGPTAGAAIGGAVGGYLSTGNLQGAMFGMLSGLAATGISGIGGLNNLSRSTLHGLSQGAISRAGGGRFGDGALGAFFSGLASPAVGRVQGQFRQALVSATVGGTASAIGGGKFSNGALSAAWVELFNHQSARLRRLAYEAKSHSERLAIWEDFSVNAERIAAETWDRPNVLDKPVGSTELPSGGRIRDFVRRTFLGALGDAAVGQARRHYWEGYVAAYENVSSSLESYRESSIGIARRGHLARAIRWSAYDFGASIPMTVDFYYHVGEQHHLRPPSCRLERTC